MCLAQVSHRNPMAGNHPNQTSPYWSFSSSMESAMDTFEFSEFLELDDWCEEEPLCQMITDHPQPSLLQAMNEDSPSEGGVSTSQDGPRNDGGNNMGGIQKFVFKTKSDIDVLDDGYKWRKYGKKKVRSSPNPRNYYKCSAIGCHVKKRIERMKEDETYVITTYEGTHNHEGHPPSSQHRRNSVILRSHPE
ncbi:unnamed protein product [Cuscuta europaea]|uniref:WRKY domain-containing protein n=1 Tax=Cuscuta europaea TaxID=41803 RepID=A0A9P1E3U1_CUSEU|nr:unnamed protein product [Cuscuta europaea]